MENYSIGSGNHIRSALVYSSVIARAKNKLHGLLRWSEKYTKTDMVYLAHGGFWLTLGQAVSSLSALALAVAFANLVPPEVYGTYKYILSIAGMFAIFTLPGLGTALTRATAQGHGSIIHAATHLRIKSSIVGAISALIGSLYYFINDNNTLSLSLLIIAVSLPFFDTFTLYLSYLVGKRQFNVQTRYHVFSQIVSVGVLITTLVFTENILLILLAYFLPLTIVRFFLYLRTIRTVPREVDSSEQSATLTYGTHLTAMQILGVIAANIDKILLWKFLGPVQLAVYAFAIAIPEQLKGPLKGIGELALPKFAGQTPEQIRQNMPALWRKLGLYATGLLIISVLYILAAPFIFAILFPQYIESVIYSQIFSLSLITGVSTIALSILIAQKKTKAQYIISTVQPIINIALFAVLIPFYGIMGAIVAWVLGRFILAVMYLGTIAYLR